MKLFKNKINIWLFLIILLAAILRIFGINFGLPHIYEFDESFMVDIAVKMLATGNFNPYWFDYPGSTMIYPLYFVYLIVYIFSLITGSLPHLSVFLQHYHQTDPTLLYLLGRFLAFAYGIGSIIILYFLTKKIFNAKTALLASFFLAINSLHIERSQLIRADSALIFFVLLTVYFSVLIYERKKTKYYILAGIFLGLAVSSKYPGLVGLIPVFLAFFFTEVKTPQQNFFLKFLLEKKLILFYLTFWAVFFITTPFFIPSLDKAIYDINYEARAHQLGQDRLPGLLNHFWYLTNALPQNMGLLGIALSFASVFYFLFFKKPLEKPLVILISFIVVFWLFIGTLNLRWTHWILPIVPFLCLLEAALLIKLFAKINIKIKNKTLSLVACGLILLAISANPLYKSLANGYLLSVPNTLKISALWCIENIPQNSKIAVARRGPTIPKDIFQVRRENFLAINPLSFYKENKYEYLITTSYLYERFEKEKDLYPKFHAFYQELFSTAELFQEFNSNPLPDDILSFIIKRPDLSKIISGETIRIYKL